MPDLRGTGKKDINARADVLRASAREDQRRVTEELNFYNAAAKDVRKTAKDLEAAERAYEKRDSARNARIYDEANAAHLAAEILAISDDTLYEKLMTLRESGREKVLEKNRAIEAMFNS